MTTLSVVIAASLALVSFMALANLVMIQYSRGVARTAVEEAVRRSSPDGGQGCTEILDEVMKELLGGPYGDGLIAECWSDGGSVTAEVAGPLGIIIPLVPEHRLRARATATIGDRVEG
jgi:hypothetical protein